MTETKTKTTILEVPCVTARQAISFAQRIRKWHLEKSETCDYAFSNGTHCLEITTSVRRNLELVPELRSCGFIY